MLNSIDRTVATPAGFSTPGLTTKGHHPPSIQELVQDLQEEISFAHSEKTEEKSIKEFEVEDHNTHILEHLIARVEEERPAGDPSDQNKEDTLEKALLAGHLQNAEDLQEALENLSQDKSEAFSLLVHLAASSALPKTAQDLLHEALKDYARHHHAQITAGFNTAALAQQTAAHTHIPASSLQHTYQEAVTSYEGILPALLKIIAAGGVEKFEDNTQFLMQAAQVDLASEHSSVQPERLKRILSELQGLKIFNTLRDRLRKIITRLAGQFSQCKTLKPKDWLSRTLHHAHDPSLFEQNIKSGVLSLAPAPRVLFLQELRGLIRSLPEYLFSTPTEKHRILFPLQKEIDTLIFKKGA